ncbi:hypothetical protein NUW58_g9199 [Xylaria curta]|uniref:Uncharacterized protein n=1 Tax=Xylaria curta TaxID=42375 RepID=A0ACC1MZF1_9PEZI|nr:hypothetical protein NUW58_g9199 [Xylaria curta]
MEPPSKRLRLDRADDTDDEDNQDELSMTPAQFNAIQDPMYQLDKKRAKAATRLKSTFEDIFEKYGKDFDGDDDVINLYTDEIEVDNGHVQSLAKQKDGVAEDSLSSDEEARILSGRPRRRGPKSPKSPKPLIPARRTKYNPNQGPQFHSPWNEPPGLGTYRLSSLAFSSPYGAHPPFDFGRSAFGNGPIDPVWQTPDLPIQLPYHQHGSLIGLGGSQFGSIGAQPHPATKRLVSAKSFLLCDASTSSGATNGNVEEEEDEILLGGDGQDKSPFSHQRGPEKATLAAPSKAISYQSSRSTGQVPSPHETSLTKNKLHKKPNGPRKELARDGAMELTVSGIVLPTHQTAGGNVQHQAANGSHPRKRGRPKKLDSYKPATSPHEESGTETRTLQPNERRIEVVIPTMKHLFSTETDSEWATQELAVAADKNTHELGIRPGLPVNEDTETTHLNDDLHSSQSISSHDDAVSYNPFTELTEDPQKNVDSTHPIQTTEELSASKSSESQDLQESLSKQTHELIDTSISHSLLRCEKDLEIAGIEVSQESEPPQTVVDDPIGTASTDSLDEMGQKPNCDDENDEGDSGRRPSSAADVGVDGKQEAQEMCVGVMLIDEHNIEATPAPSPLLTDELCGGVVGNKPESNPTTTETAVSETVILQAMDNVPYENNHDSGDELDPPPTSTNGEEILAVSPAVTSSMTAQYPDQQLEDVPRSSGNPVSHENRISISGQDVGSRNLEYSAIHETMESDFPPDQDHLFSSHKATSFSEDEQDASNKSSFASVLVAEIDGLQLDSGRLDGQRSPSLGATDLTDQDLSVFPTSSDARFTSELIPKSRARDTNQARNNVRDRIPDQRFPNPNNSHKKTGP